MSSNRYISEILREYDSLQSAEESSQKKRQDEIYKKIPKIKSIDDEISSTGFEIASAILKGTNVEDSIYKLRQRITDLKIQKGELLAANKYPLDYLEIKYKCKKCKDTGYMGSVRCSCFKQRLINKYYQQSNLKDILSRENFDTFNIAFYSTNKYGDEELSPRRNMEDILTYCINYANSFKDHKENLFFYGTSGLGKTFLSNCIAKELLDKGTIVIYQTCANLIDIIRTSRFDDSSEKDMTEDLLTCDLLIIDDFGTEPQTAYSQSELFNLINSRILSGKKMIISTNFSLEDLNNIYPERIKSRLFGHFTMFKFYGDDIRIKNNINKRRTMKR